MVCHIYCVFDGTCTYHKGTDAPLRRVPFEAAVYVAARVDQDHDAASNSGEVAQKQLGEKQKGKQQKVKHLCKRGFKGQKCAKPRNGSWGCKHAVRDLLLHCENGISGM